MRANPVLTVKLSVALPFCADEPFVWVGSSVAILPVWLLIICLEDLLKFSEDLFFGEMLELASLTYVQDVVVNKYESYSYVRCRVQSSRNALRKKSAADRSTVEGFIAPLSLILLQNGRRAPFQTPLTLVGLCYSGFGKSIQMPSSSTSL
jgi:hypothetical protein